MRTKRRIFPIVMFLPVALQVSFVGPVCASGDERMPGWEQLLEEMVQRTDQGNGDSDLGSPPASIAPGSPGLGTAPEATLHPAVEKFVRYFRGPGVGHYRQSLERLQAYRVRITRVLNEEGIPAEMVWVGMVESGYNPEARSPKNALGIWQLIPETAASFGLSLAPQDERTDPYKSTRAAARYLKFLYARFGDWKLTLAAYNAGEQRVQEAMQQTGSRDFWRLAALGLLPKETRAYVPAVLAAQLLGTGRIIQEESGVHDGATTPRAKVAFAPHSLSP